MRFWLFAASLALACAAGPKAEIRHHWKLLEGTPLESRIQVTQADRVVGDYVLSCRVAEHEPEGGLGEPVAVVLVPAYGRSLLVVRCHTGAHGQRIVLLDPQRDADAPIIARTGSYFARWEPRGDALWIEYDQPCDRCDPPFETLGEVWPPVAEGDLP